MNGFKTIVSKELYRVFKDKKMVFSMFILPVLMVIGIFAIMFFVISNSENNIQTHVSEVYIMNAPSDFRNIIEDVDGSNIHYADTNEEASIKDDILKGNTDLLIEFPENFEELVNAENVTEIPQIKTYYNPSEDYSDQAHTKYTENYIETLRNKYIERKYGSVEAAGIFTVDSDNEESIIQDDDKAIGKMLGMFIPYIITMLLFAGAMALGVDAIAGEKERGTLASLLLCPVSRYEIAFGKIVSLAIMSLMSSIVYVGMMFAAFGIFTNFVDLGAVGFSFSLSAVQIIEIIVLIIGIVLLYVAIIGIISVTAKTVKEAQTYISPIYLIIVIVGMATMFTQGSPSTISYMIPIYNVSITFKAIFTKEITTSQFLLAVLITYLLVIVLTGLIAKAFKSEKTVFAN